MCAYGSGAGSPVGPAQGYAVPSQEACAKEASRESNTFESSLRRRRQQLRERQTRIEQKIQLLSELLRVFEED